MYSSENFYMGTEAHWNDAEAPEREADYVSDSGSAYRYRKAACSASRATGATRWRAATGS